MRFIIFLLMDKIYHNLRVESIEKFVKFLLRRIFVLKKLEKICHDVIIFC